VDVCECHVAEVLGAVVIDRSSSASGGAFIINNPLVPHDSWNSVDIILEHPLAIYILHCNILSGVSLVQDPCL